MPDNESLSPLERNLPQRVNGYNPTLYELEPQRGETHFTFASFWHIVMKRLTTIIAATVVVAVLTGIYTLRLQPVYRATATVEVETTQPQLQTLSEVYRQSSGDDYTFLTTQIQVLQSNSLAWTTLQQLGMDRYGPAESSANAPGQTPAQLAAARKADLISGFKGGLRVEQVKDSRILAVSYDSSNPEIAARAANLLIENYKNSNFEEKTDFTRHASAGMEEQLQELKAKVEKSQQALVDYERRNLIVNVGDKGTINDQRLEQLNRDYTEAEGDLDQKQSVYELVKANESQVGMIVEDKILENLEEKLNDLKSQYADALNQYGPNFPKAVRLREQVAQTQGLVDAARKQAIFRVQNNYQAAVNRVTLLGESLAKEKTNVSAINERMIDYNILKRDFEINQQLYESLLQRLKDATLSASLQVTNVHLIDAASVPSGPDQPQPPAQYGGGIDVRDHSGRHSGLCAGGAGQLGAHHGGGRAAGQRPRPCRHPGGKRRQPAQADCRQRFQSRSPCRQHDGHDGAHPSFLAGGGILSQSPHLRPAFHRAASSPDPAGDERADGRGEDFHRHQPRHVLRAAAGAGADHRR